MASREQVIEAIAEQYWNSLNMKYDFATMKSKENASLFLEDSYSFANQIVRLTYPSGNPMIGILRDEQDFPILTLNDVGEEDCFFNPEMSKALNRVFERYLKRLKDAGCRLVVLPVLGEGGK